MKFIIGSLSVLSCLIAWAPAYAQDLARQLQDLREDVTILQRQIYRENDKTSSANGEVQGKISEYDETIRKLNGRMDELEHQLKSNDEKIEKYNRDMEIRLKIIEGRQIPDNLIAPAPKMPETYSAPVAKNAAQAVAGEKISGDDLVPLDGETSKPQNIVPTPSDGTIINANNPQTMYDNAMKAFNSGFYDEAELGFEDILHQFPQHALASNAQYWLGEIYIKQNNLNKAKVAFKDGYDKYKNGNKGADSLYRLAVTFEMLDDNHRACLILMSFDDEYPSGHTEIRNKVAAEKQKLKCKRN